MEILEIVSGPEYEQMMQGSGRRHKHKHNMKTKYHLVYKNFFNLLVAQKMNSIVKSYCYCYFDPANPGLFRVYQVF